MQSQLESLLTTPGGPDIALGPSQLFIFLKYIQGMWAHVCGHRNATAHMWRSEDIPRESVLSLHHGESGDQIQIVRL